MRYLAAAIFLFAFGTAKAAECRDHAVQEMFSISPVVMLAHVTESTFPASVTRENVVAAFQATATLTVLKSWKGPLSTGAVVKAGPPNFPTSGPWSPRAVHVGDDVLIFSWVADPIWLNTCWVIDKVDAEADIALLDTLVTDTK